MSTARETLYTIGRKTVWLLPMLSLIIAGAAVWIMTVLVVAEVTGRNLFSFGIPFAAEYTEYLIPVVGVGGAAYCLSKGGHVKADILLWRMPDRTRQGFIMFGLVVGLVFTIVFTVKILDMALDSIEQGIMAMYPTETIIGYPQLILVASLLLFAVQLIVEIVRKARLLL